MSGFLPFLPIIESVFDRVLPNEKHREAAKLALLKAQQAGQLDDLKTRLGAILAEANSDDPWTSRARPSFLYVIYILILTSIPTGIAYAIEPAGVLRFIEGMQLWLAAIPGELWTLFGAGYLGYAGLRHREKIQKIKSVAGNHPDGSRPAIDEASRQPAPRYENRN